MVCIKMSTFYLKMCLVKDNNLENYMDANNFVYNFYL